MQPRYVIGVNPPSIDGAVQTCFTGAAFYLCCAVITLVHLLQNGFWGDPNAPDRVPLCGACAPPGTGLG